MFRFFYLIVRLNKTKLLYLMFFSVKEVYAIRQDQ